MATDVIYNVKNRSAGMCVYKIPELNIRREFAPGEIKKIPFSELEKLTYQPGGPEILREFLQVDLDVTTKLNIRRELEYDMSEADVDNLLLRGSLDAFLDALDFAPIGVKDLIKLRAVKLPLTDLNKRKALLDKTGFDVDKALVHIEEERIEENAPAAPAAQRRVKPAEPTGRRTLPNYNVVKVEDPTTVEE